MQRRSWCLTRVVIGSVLLVRAGGFCLGQADLSKAFGEAQGLINEAQGQGVNVGAAQSALNQARQQYNKYLSMQQNMVLDPPAWQSPRSTTLQTINPFGDYLFHGVSIKPLDGKLVTRTWDDWGKNEFGPMRGLPDFEPSGGIAGNNSGAALPEFHGSTGSDGKPFVPAAPPPDVAGGKAKPSTGSSDPGVVDLTGSKTLTPQLLCPTLSGSPASGSVAGNSSADPGVSMQAPAPPPPAKSLDEYRTAAREKLEDYAIDKLKEKGNELIDAGAEKLGAGWVKSLADDAEETYGAMTQQNEQFMGGTFGLADRLVRGQYIDPAEADNLLLRGGSDWIKMSLDRIKASVKTGISGGVSGSAELEPNNPVMPILGVPHPDENRVPLFNVK